MDLLFVLYQELYDTLLQLIRFVDCGFSIGNHRKKVLKIRGIGKIGFFKKNSDYIALVLYIIIGLLDFEKKLETLSEC